MHFIIDINGTLDSGKELPDIIEKWREIVDLMKANGHTISVMSAGVINKQVLQHCGFEEDEFTCTHSEASKTVKFFKDVAESEKISTNELCAIDDAAINIFMAEAAGAETILYKDIDSLKAELVKRKYIPQ